MLVCVSENQKVKNGLKSLFFEKKTYLPFSYVQLVMVPVHSDRSSCTFTCDSVHLPLWFGTFGYHVCTLAFLVQLVNVIVHLSLCIVQLVNLIVHLLLFPVQMDVKL